MKRFIPIALIFALSFLTRFFVNPAAMTDDAPQVDDVLWTRWRNEHYALADDGDFIWIGTGAGIVRWEKATETYMRFGTPDGIPHRNVYAVAVDAGGNRWFGGDAGVSKLDMSDVWTHYSADNSDLASDVVKNIAVTAGGSVYFLHEGEVVTRVSAENDWTVFPNRHTVAQLHGSDILQTLHQNSLWATRLNEIWIGFDVWDGIKWSMSRPANTIGDPTAMMVGSSDKLWVLLNDQLLTWDGIQWEVHANVGGGCGSGARVMTVADDDSVWIGSNIIYCPSSIEGTPILSRIIGESDIPALEGVVLYDAVTRFGNLLQTEEGMWGIGDGWFLTPNRLILFGAPLYDNAKLIEKDANNDIWLNSIGQGRSAIQRVEDNGTMYLGDDSSTIIENNRFTNAMTAHPDGSMWMVNLYSERIGPTYYSLSRYRHDESVSFLGCPRGDDYCAIGGDIFIEPDGRIWTVELPAEDEHPYYIRGVQPALNADDSHWIIHTIQTDSLFKGSGHVGVTADGTLWFGNNSGLYRLDDELWVKVFAESIQDIIIANDGSVIAPYSDAYLLFIDPSGEQTTEHILTFTSVHRALLPTLSANNIWKLGPQGEIWFLSYLESVTRLMGSHLVQVTFPQSPVSFRRKDISDWAVDEYGQVWFAVDGALWRLNWEPDYELADQFVMVEAGGTAVSGVQVVRWRGFDEVIGFEIDGMAAGITGTVSAEAPVQNTHALLTIQTAADLALGTYTGTLTATADGIERQATLTIMVVDEVYQGYLPLMSMK